MKSRTRISLPRKAGLLIAAATVLTLWVAGCGTPTYNSQLGRIVKPYRFSVAGWEVQNLANNGRATPDDTAVRRYFSLSTECANLTSDLHAIDSGNSQQDRTALQARLDAAEKEKAGIQTAAELTLTQQISATLDEMGICANIAGVKFDVPPVSFRLAPPPHLLAVSPLDHIELKNQIMLDNSLTGAEVESIESSVDKLGVAALVTELGGYGATYPTFVADDADMKWTIETAIHEWLHQYLAFKPLGFRYVLDGLGIVKNYDVVSINETAVDIAAKEINSVLLAKYYPDLLKAGDKPANSSGFDFNQEMRNARRTVDGLLAQGKIDEAAKFMEQERLYLQTKGYYIRKLNQAYFAFNGIYADSPTSVDPLGEQLRTLRAKSASLKDFLDSVSVMTAREDVVRSIK